MVKHGILMEFGMISYNTKYWHRARLRALEWIGSMPDDFHGKTRIIYNNRKPKLIPTWTRHDNPIISPSEFHLWNRSWRNINFPFTL